MNSVTDRDHLSFYNWSHYLTWKVYSDPLVFIYLLLITKNLMKVVYLRISGKKMEENVRRDEAEGVFGHWVKKANGLGLKGEREVEWYRKTVGREGGWGIRPSQFEYFL